MQQHRGYEGHGGDGHERQQFESTPNTVGFPYGFPTPGNYRIFVQMKHANAVETATFDANVQ